MKRTRIVLLGSLLVALTVAAGQALAGIPNIELMTFLIFVSGFLLGPKLGGVVGVCAMGAHSLFNWLGPAALPVWVAQIVCYGLVGVIGGIAGPRVVRARALPAAVMGGALGAALTFGYQLLVNTATFFVYTNDAGLWPFIWAGVAFAAVQVVWNTGLFFVSLRPTLAVLEQFRAELREEETS